MTLTVLCRCVFQFSHGIQVNLLIVATSVGMLVCSTDNYLLRCVDRLVFIIFLLGGGGGGGICGCFARCVH